MSDSESDSRSTDVADERFVTFVTYYNMKLTYLEMRGYTQFHIHERETVLSSILERDYTAKSYIGFHLHMFEALSKKFVRPNYFHPTLTRPGVISYLDTPQSPPFFQREFSFITHNDRFLHFIWHNALGFSVPCWRFLKSSA